MEESPFINGAKSFKAFKALKTSRAVAKLANPEVVALATKYLKIWAKYKDIRYNFIIIICLIFCHHFHFRPQDQKYASHDFKKSEEASEFMEETSESLEEPIGAYWQA